MHGNKRSKDGLELKKSWVHLYCGLIVATWNIYCPSFDAFLGDAKFYLDQLFCRSDNGLEMLGPPQRFVLTCNWKLPAEQPRSDGFHTLTLHRSLMDRGIMGGTQASIYHHAPGMFDFHIGTDQPHTTITQEAESHIKLFSEVCLADTRLKDG